MFSWDHACVSVCACGFVYYFKVSVCYACGLSVFDQVRSGSHTEETPGLQHLSLSLCLTNKHTHTLNQECVCFFVFE